MHRNLNPIIIYILLLSAAFLTILSGCLDEPPALPERNNPWDPDNPGPPRAPDSLRGTALSETEIRLAWRDRSGNEDGFRIWESIDNDTMQFLVGMTGTDACSYEMNDRAPQSDYYFFVESYNEAGASYRAGPIFATTRHSPPCGPTELTAQTVSQTSLKLNWRDHSDIEIQFDLEESIGTGSNYHSLISLPADCTSCLVTGRTPLVTHYYRVRATNEYGLSRFSEPAWATPGNFPPEPPTALTPEIVSETEINVRWTDESANETGFMIFEGANDSLNFVLMASANANMTNRLISGRLPATTYYYHIRSINNYGQSVFSNKVRASTAEVRPTAPIQLETGIVTETSVELIWLDRSFNENEFQVELSIGDPDTFNQVGSIPTDITEFSVTDLPIFEVCYFRVRAVNGFGASSYSNRCIAVPGGFAPAAPENLEAAVVSASEITLTWLDMSCNEESFELQECVDIIGSFRAIATTGADTTSATLEGKLPDRDYYYRIRAMNRFGESLFSNIASVHTPP